MDKDKNRRGMVFLGLCSVGFVCLTTLVLLYGQKRLNWEFDMLVSDNLASHTSIQRSQISGLLRDVENTLKAISRMASLHDCDVTETGIDWVLKGMEDGSGYYHMDYVPMEQVYEKLLTDKDYAVNGDDDKQLLQKLLNGEPVVSDIENRESYNGYYFSIAQSVVKDETVLGVLRVNINAALFEQLFQKSGLYDNVLTCMVDHDGNILYSNAKQYRKNGNIFESSLTNGLSSEAVIKLREALDRHKAATSQIKDGDRNFFVSVGDLQYSNWSIVNFLKASDVLLKPDAISRRMIGGSVLLIFITAFTSGGMVLAYQRQRRRLDTELKRYSMLSRFSDTILFQYTYDGDTIEFTPNASKRLHTKSLSLKGITSDGRSYTLLHPEDLPVLVKMIREFPQEGQAHKLSYCEVRLKNMAGDYNWYGCQLEYVFEDGKPVCIVGKLADITDQRCRERKLLDQACKDLLTDTYNKSGEYMIRERLTRKCAGLFFMIDLDDFKMINDTYGHMAGDLLLAEVGKTLKRTFRNGDIVARVGGDEFVVFIPEFSDPALGKRKARDIVRSVSRIRLKEYPLLRISVSVGVAVCPRDATTYEELYAAADQAMYRVKGRKKAK